VRKNPPQGLKLEWVKKCIINPPMFANTGMYMNPEERAQWASTITYPSHPEDVPRMCRQNFAAITFPMVAWRGGQSVWTTPVPSPLASDSTAPGSVFDPSEDPPVPATVFDKYIKRKRV
jgi:hypothetical protein